VASSSNAPQKETVLITPPSAMLLTRASGSSWVTCGCSLGWSWLRTEYVANLCFRLEKLEETVWKTPVTAGMMGVVR
jgi:hypothetical protein